MPVMEKNKNKKNIFMWVILECNFCFHARELEINAVCVSLL